MHPQAHRKAIVISALLTAFLLVTAAGGLFLANRWTAMPADAAGASGPAIVVTTQPSGVVQPVDLTLQQASAGAVDQDPVIAAYQARLQEAYTALDQAYTQIDRLQTAQAQPAVSRGEDHERFEHESGEHQLFAGQGELEND